MHLRTVGTSLCLLNVILCVFLAWPGRVHVTSMLSLDAAHNHHYAIAHVTFAFVIDPNRCIPDTGGGADNNE